MHATHGMLLHVLVSVLEPDPPGPQLGLQGVYEACQRVRLPQQAQLTKQVLIYSASRHQGQHLTRYAKGLQHLELSTMLLCAYTWARKQKEILCILSMIQGKPMSDPRFPLTLGDFYQCC